MSFVTTLMIVLTLTGGPVARTICVTWCDEVPASGEAPCHQHVAQPVSDTVSDGSDACVQLLSDTLFVKEEDRAATKWRIVTAQGHDVGMRPMAHATWYWLPDENSRSRGFAAPPTAHRARSVPIYLEHLTLLI